MATKPKGRAVLPKKKGEARSRPKAPTAKAKTRGAAKAEAKAKRGRKPGTPNKKFGLPIKEATSEMSIPLLQVDITKAEKTKPSDVNSEDNFLCCVIAQAVTRACGAERVAIMREIAYVAFPGEGVTRRFRLDKRSRKIVEAWDRGEDVTEGVELRLKPPGKTHSRKQLAERNREWHEQHPGTYNTRKGKQGRKTKRRNRTPDPHSGEVRNGNLVKW